MASSSGGGSYASSFARQISPARSVVFLPPRRSQRSKFAVEEVIAINTDPGAPMMSRADYAVIGDLHEVIPALVTALRGQA